MLNYVKLLFKIMLTLEINKLNSVLTFAFVYRDNSIIMTTYHKFAVYLSYSEQHRGKEKQKYKKNIFQDSSKLQQYIFC